MINQTFTQTDNKPFSEPNMIDLLNNLSINANNQAFKPSRNALSNRLSRQKNTGWRCNISQSVKFKHSSNDQIQINTQSKQQQFDFICRLLNNQNCAVIYFDAHFNSQELAKIRQLQQMSGTELVNAKMACFFAVA